MRIVTFASGSTGNCTLISMDGTHLLIDAGISCKRIKENLALSALSPEALSGILITHEHGDHIGGLSMLLKHHAVPVYATPVVARSLRRSISGIEARLHVVAAGESCAVGALTVRPFLTPHDTEESAGWRICGSSVFAFATDMGHVTEEAERGLLGADAVVIEANHDIDMLISGPYPAVLKRRILSERGHLSNPDCAALAARLEAAGTRCIILGHLSRENNEPSLAFKTVRAALHCDDTRLYAAPADNRLTVELSGGAVCSI